MEYYTPIIDKCVVVGDEIYTTATTTVYDNIINTEQLGYNTMTELFYIMADITGEAATS